jgi:hypothetical protein
LTTGAMCTYDNDLEYLIKTFCEVPVCKCLDEVSKEEREVTIKHPCNFDDPRCWKESNWTISYDALTRTWISFHDWYPSLFMPSQKHFYSILDNMIWKHNDRYDSFCTYYGTNYNFEIEFPVTTPNNITTLKSIEYTLEVFKYYNNGKDYNHLLDENFDRAIIYNSEQISGLLKLNLKGKNSPLDLINYPIVTPTDINVLYSKEENKYRLNQFWDVTNDRGEFSGNTTPMFITDENGYRKTINPAYTNYTKLQKKKFRHYGNNIILRKLNTASSNAYKFILKLVNTKNLNSPR